MLILGEEERATESIIFKELARHHQETIQQIELFPFMEKIFNKIFERE